MAAQQLLSLIIQAVDKASGTIGKVGSGLRGLGGDAKTAQAGTSGLSDSIAFGMVKAQAAIALVQVGVGKLQGMLQEASTIELENLSTATGLEEMIGDFGKATEFVDGLNTALAKSAAALPGATAEYASLARTITDDVAVAFKDANGKINDMPGFQKTVESMATSYSAMAATTPGVSNQDMQNFMIKALGGTSSQAELNQLDALQKNAPLRTRLEAAMEKEGVTDLKELDADKRIKLMEEVGRKVITPQFLAQSQNTVEGLTQSFISSVFDPMGGVFGVMKDLEPDVKGQQTAFEAFKVSLKLVIGPGGLFEQIGGVFGAVTGIDANSPMEALRGGFLWVNGYLTQINKGLEYVRGLLGKQSPAEILQKFGGMLQGSLSNIGEKAAQFVNGMFGSFFSNLDGLLSSIDYGQAVKQIGSGVVFVVGQIGSFLANLDPQVYAAIAFGLLAVAAITAIAGFAATLVVGFLAATVGLPGLLVVAAGFAIGALAKAIIDNWGEIQAILSEMFGSLAAAFQGSIDLAIGIATGDGAKIQQALRELFTGVTSWLTQAQDTWAELTGGKTSGQDQADDVEQRSMEKLYAAQNAQERWRGQIPTAAGGFLPAINSEIRNMPANASPVIANSSEFILRPEQMSRLMQGAASVGGGSGTFAPQITIQGITDPEGVAKEVLRYLEVFFSEFQAGALA